MFERLSNLFKRTAKAGGKDNMPETQVPATPPAASGGEFAKFKDEILAALGGALKPITDEIAALKGAASSPKPAAPVHQEALTADQVGKIVADQLKAGKTEAAAEATRAAFITEKMKDLPSIYQRALGSDPTKWAAEEQALRTQARTDHGLLGGTTPTVAGTPPLGGVSPSAPVDLSKISGTDAIRLGLQNSVPARAPQAAPPATAGATTVAVPAAK